MRHAAGQIIRERTPLERIVDAALKANREWNLNRSRAHHRTTNPKKLKRPITRRARRLYEK